ncbi:MAG: radical SAM protein, partial [Deltaproteobacteria bacterium]|nr:radical SAM protein [Deltaproteobacteria bacterium]
MRILLPTLHVRQSAQAVPLAAGNLKACLPPILQNQTELLDLFPRQTGEEMAAAILARRPQLIAFPLYLWNRQPLLQLCHRLRQQQADLFLLGGGPEASADAAGVIAEGNLDGVICGEGELPFVQLASRLQRGQPAAAIPGFLAAGSGRTIVPAVCPDLSQLPSPWLQGILPLQEGCGVLWEVARGCRFNCAFCYDAKGHQGVRPLPLERLRAELQLFVTKGVAQVWILDSTFNAPPERGKQLLRMLIDEAPQIHFHLEAKADFLDEATAELLAQLSCSVQIGLQSANPDVLKPLHRTLKTGQMDRALQQLTNQGVTYGLDLIYGLPGDNHRGFCDSLDFTLQRQPNQVDIFPLAVLPGTELYQHQTEFGLTADPRPPYLVQTNSSYSSVELAQSQQLAVATDIFYNRGRAVGFFLQICDALSSRPAELLGRFSDWLNARPELSTEQKTCAEGWQPLDILPLQQDFVAAGLLKSGKKNLRQLAEDLINYHFRCAELLLAQDCQPADNLPAANRLLKQRWRLNPAVQIQRFHYDLEELEQVGGEKLSWLHKQL